MRSGSPLLWKGALGLACALFAESAWARPPSFVDALADGSVPELERAFFRAGELFIAVTDDPDLARARGLIPVTSRLAVGSGRAEGMRSLLAENISLSFGPPRRPQLDVAVTHQNAGKAKENYGLDGTGVYVGLVDTGVSLAHPDLRRADGSTRIAWLLTFDETPRGLQPELEESYGCARNRCAVLSGADIDMLLAAGVPDETIVDTYGHGTHVASAIAGDDKTYPGIAPGAELIVVQAGGGTGSISDPQILLGAKFAFDRAADAGRPVALNLSLGSNFGPHDGSTLLEEGLAELGAGEGRAVIVASGNSGAVYSLPGSNLPEPLGSHTETSVHAGAETRVTLATAYSGTAELEVYGYVSTQPGDEVQVAFRGGNGAVSGFVSRGRYATLTSKEIGDGGNYSVILVNGADQGNIDLAETSLAFFLSGQVQGGANQELVFRGHGTVRVWVESSVVKNGTTSPGAALLPRARTSGTVTIPASHPALITVGASVNRTEWIDYEGNEIGVDDEEEDGVAFFSSAGPNQLGQMKPDLLAPGSNLAAAMAEEADPRRPGVNSQFSSGGYCPPGAAPECFVLDDTHGIASGTSMAAPQVTGTVALLFQRDPSLTMDQVRELLRGGARAPLDEGFPSNWYGAGSLDVVGALLAQDALASGEEGGEPSRARSRLSFASSFLYPNPERSVEMFALLRDDDGKPLPTRMEDYKVLTDVAEAKLLRASPGVLTAEVRAPRGAGGKTGKVRVLYQGREILAADLAIGPDPTTAVLGFDVQGGCAVARSPARSSSPWLLLILGWPCLLRLSRPRPSLHQSPPRPRPMRKLGKTREPVPRSV